MRISLRHYTRTMMWTIVALALAGSAAATPYPPEIVRNPSTQHVPTQPSVQGLIFTNTHAYPWNADPNGVVIKVEVYDNFAGDFTKYHWVYTVTNNSYEPTPGTSNGFSGFELALPAAVPDIGDITAPDGIGPWAINCCSGLPVEWDLSNSAGAPVAGGTLPGQTEQYTFTTSPRLVTVSNGWFHTWENDIQAFIVNYTPGDEPEVPDVLTDPGQERCCYQEGGAWQCQIFPAGQCAAIGGLIVPDCAQCPPNTPTDKKSWGTVKTRYR
jgi:hypothetical protein